MQFSTRERLSEVNFYDAYKCAPHISAGVVPKTIEAYGSTVVQTSYTLIIPAYPCSDEASLLSLSSLPCYQSPVISKLLTFGVLIPRELWICTSKPTLSHIAAVPCLKITLPFETCNYLYSTNAHSLSSFMSRKNPVGLEEENP